MDDTRYFTLTSPAGRFVFRKNTLLSHAKLIRDAITAGHRGTLTSVPRPKPGAAMMWIRENIAGPLSKENITFEWIPA